jgi:hypothetical protein
MFRLYLGPSSRFGSTPITEETVKKLGLTVALVFSTLAVLPQSAEAQEEKPISLGLVTPIQIVPEDQSVGIFRFSLIYGNNVAVRYLDLGLVSRTELLNEGVQLGVVGIGHDFVGLQWNWAGSYNTGELVGVQLASLGNYTVLGTGVQAAPFFNGADAFVGLQIALVNYTKALDGLQIGLINIITDGGDIFGLPVFPFVNFDF